MSLRCCRSVEGTRVHSCWTCRSVTKGDVLNLGIKLDVFLYGRRRLESNLTDSSMCAFYYHTSFLCNKQKTEVTIIIMCNIHDIISVCFVLDRGSLSCQTTCFRKTSKWKLAMSQCLTEDCYLKRLKLIIPESERSIYCLHLVCSCCVAC